MPTIQAIRQGIANNLAAGLSPNVQVSGYLLANPSPVTVWVLPSELQYDLTAGVNGLEQYTMTVQAIAPVGTDISSQQLLDDLLDEPNSAKALIEADKTLGGAVSTLHVTSCTGYRQVMLEGRGATIICEWTVTVWAKSV